METEPESGTEIVKRDKSTQILWVMGSGSHSHSKTIIHAAKSDMYCIDHPLQWGEGIWTWYIGLIRSEVGPRTALCTLPDRIGVQQALGESTCTISLMCKTLGSVQWRLWKSKHSTWARARFLWCRQHSATQHWWKRSNNVLIHLNLTVDLTRPSSLGICSQVSFSDVVPAAPAPAAEDDVIDTTATDEEPSVDPVADDVVEDAVWAEHKPDTRIW